LVMDFMGLLYHKKGCPERQPLLIKSETELYVNIENIG
jgi:hypothetical protein